MRIRGVVHWNEAARQWRLEGLKEREHLQEFFDCAFIQTLTKREGITKEGEHVVIIDIRKEAGLL